MPIRSRSDGGLSLQICSSALRLRDILFMCIELADIRAEVVWVRDPSEGNTSMPEVLLQEIVCLLARTSSLSKLVNHTLEVSLDVVDDG
jgi:hypothetical protein